MAGTHDWEGASGKVYTYEIHEMREHWYDMPGNYIFAYESSPQEWTPVYIGQTESLQDSLAYHFQLTCIRRNFGTHVHTRMNKDKDDRLAEERDLLARFKPPCNE